MDNTAGSIPPDSKARDYLDARGIDIDRAVVRPGWLSWSDDRPEMLKRLGVNGSESEWRNETMFHDQHKGGGREKRRRKPRLLELLSFPVHGTDAAWMNKAFYDVNPASISGKGFRCTYGTRRPIFIPPETWDIRRDATIPIVLVEGPAKALAVQQAGLMAIGFNGTWMSEPVPDKEGLLKARERQKQLSQVLRAFNWYGRTVYFALDADQLFNPMVRRSIVRNFILFHAANADVRQLTTWDIREGKGIDDLLVARGGREKAAETLNGLIGEAPPFVETLDKQKDGVFIMREMHNVAMAPVQFETLKDDIARVTGIGKRVFGKPPERKEGKEEKGVAAEWEIDPSPWPEEVSLGDVLDGMEAEMSHYAGCPTELIDTIVLWAATTCFMDVWQQHPFLGITAAMKNSGKTTIMLLLSYFCYRPWVSSNITPASVYRTVHVFHPTLLVDEMKATFAANPDLALVFKAAYTRRSSLIPRVERVDDRFVTVNYSAWGAKCFNLVGRISEYDDQVEDRTIEIHVQRENKDSGLRDLYELISKVEQPFLEHLQKLWRWRQDNLERVKACKPKMIDFENRRVRANWRPLYVLAELAGEKWVDKIKKAIKATTERRLPVIPEPEYLVKALRKLCEGHPEAIRITAKGRKPFLPTETILGTALGPATDWNLNADGEAPWAKQRDTDPGLTAKKLGGILGGFRIKSSQPSLEKEGRKWGYFMEDLEEKAFKSIPPDEPEKEENE